jgi:non-specific serine/threonine protein kinase
VPAADGDIDAAHEAISESIALHEAHVDPTLPLSERFANEWATGVLQAATTVAILRGDDASAAGYITTILTTRFYHHNAVVGALASAAVLAARQGDNERALRLAAGAFRVGHQGAPLPGGLLDATMSSARRAVGPVRARAATASGRSMTVTQLKGYALSDALPVDSDQPDVLTPREYQVALQVARGFTNAQIAARMSISQRTVAGYLASIRQKLDLQSRVEVALWASKTASTGDPAPANAV